MGKMIIVNRSPAGEFGVHLLQKFLLSGMSIILDSHLLHVL